MYSNHITMPAHILTRQFYEGAVRWALRTLSMMKSEIGLLGSDFKILANINTVFLFTSGPCSSNTG